MKRKHDGGANKKTNNKTNQRNVNSEKFPDKKKKKVVSFKNQPNLQPFSVKLSEFVDQYTHKHSVTRIAIYDVQAKTKTGIFRIYGKNFDAVSPKILDHDLDKILLYPDARKSRLSLSCRRCTKKIENLTKESLDFEAEMKNVNQELEYGCVNEREMQERYDSLKQKLNHHKRNIELYRKQQLQHEQELLSTTACGSQKFMHIQIRSPTIVCPDPSNIHSNNPKEVQNDTIIDAFMCFDLS
jgi:hypothetical protein